MPGTYHKMEEGEGRRHKHRHGHGHHKHRHSGHSNGGHHGPSTDTSLEIPRPADVESTYKDSLYNPKDSLYGGPGIKDSLYSGEEGGHHNRGYHSGSDTRLTSPEGRRHAENTFDHVNKAREARVRSGSDRIWQDPVSRGAESGQIIHRQDRTDIQNIYLPGNSDLGGHYGKEGHGYSKEGQLKVRKPDLRGYIEPGRPGSGLAAAAALVRGDSYTPEKITTGGKVKVPPPVPQKPNTKQAGHYNKVGMEELWPGGWDEYSK